VTGKGHPVVVKLTPGQAGDAPHMPDLLGGAKRGRVTVVIGDRGYDRDDLVARVRRLRARVVIPPRANRTHRRRYSKRLDQGRNVVERYGSKVKPYRRVATRYDKLDTSYLAFVHLASVLVVLRHP
jgi:putative transposase